MIRQPEQGDLKALPALPSKQRCSRTVAATVKVYVPPVRWTPDLINQVASLLVDALVSDLHERPPEKSRRVS